MNQQEEMEHFSPPLAVLPRLDRLDRLLHYLEERRRCLSARQCCQSSTLNSMEQYNTLSSAVDEVSHRGSLMERLAVLENRVLQLSLELDIASTSRSSFSTIPTTAESKLLPGNKELDETLIMASKMDQNPVVIAQERSSIEGCQTRLSTNGRGRKSKLISEIFRRKKLFRWFQMGC